MTIYKIAIIFGLIFIFLFAGCSNTNYKINDKFSVRYFESCNCNSITMTTKNGGNGNVIFLKNVKEVKGNKDNFIVKTNPNQSSYETWVLFESKLVNLREDYSGLDKKELNRVLDTLKIGFHKVF